MKNFYIFLILLLLFSPALSLGGKKTYIAKSKKSIKSKKKKRVYIRKYPVRSNLIRGDELKLQEMLKDIYE